MTDCESKTRTEQAAVAASASSSASSCDVLIVGAGIHSLTLAAALVADCAHFSQKEHEALHAWSRCGGGRVSCHSIPRSSIRVIDKSGQWLSNWRQLFSVLQISHLRSPVLDHPDPLFEEGLLQHILDQPHRDETSLFLELARVFDQHARGHKCRQASNVPMMLNHADHPMFRLPRADDFIAFCDTLIERYKLRDLVTPASVTDISVGEDGHCTVSLDNGTTVRARGVVIACGQGRPRMPAWVTPSLYSHASDGVTATLAHVQELAADPSRMPKLVAGRKVLVVGGGLTALQCTLTCHELGCASVTMATRAPIRVQQFDVPLIWMGAHRMRLMHDFLSQTCAERAAMLKMYRPGGSVPEHAHNALMKAAAANPTTLTVWQSVQVTDATWNAAACAWQVSFSDGTTAPFHSIILATGWEADVCTEPAFQHLMRTHPIATTAGLPHLTIDLQWRPDCPCFVMGRYAALQLGPMSGNIRGAVAGSRRLADLLKSSYARCRSKGTRCETLEASLCRLQGGDGNLFSLLADTTTSESEGEASVCDDECTYHAVCACESDEP